MKFNQTLVASAIALSAGGAFALASSNAIADCAISVDTAEISVLGNEFPAIQAIVGAAEGCSTDGVTFASNLTKEHREIQVAALTADPSEYTVAVVANSTLVTLMNDGLVRPLNALIDEHAPDLPDNLKITVGDDVMAIAFMANAQHLMYRQDILEQAGVEVPTSYEEVLAAAAAIKEAGLIEYPLTGTYKSGWNLAEEFVNMLMGFGGDMFMDGSAEPNLDSDEAKAALAMMKSLTEFMNPDFLTFDSTIAAAEFEQGKAAMMNMWGSRAGSVLDDEGAAEGVVENIGFASAPTVGGGDVPASTLWWDGFTIATNTSDENAVASFQAMVSSVSDEVANANADAAVWLMAGYEPTQAAEGVLATASAGAQPYPMLPYIGLMHTALGNELVEFLQGSESAEQALADTEAAYRAAAEEAGFL